MNYKIAIFNWGELSLHSYYLAKQLSKDGIVIDFYLYTPSYAYKRPYLKKLLLDLENKNIKLIEVKCTSFEAKIIKLNRMAEFFKFSFPALLLNIFLPRRTRKHFNTLNYNQIITTSQHSLYWLFKTDADALKKIIHYSLEIHKITDPDIKKHSLLYAMINQETRLLHYIKGLIIQDELRAKEFLNEKLKSRLKIIYLPVSIPGNSMQAKADYLYKKFNLDSSKKILLYFGVYYNERKLEDIIHSFQSVTDPDLILVIHGAGNLSHIPMPSNVFVSTQFVHYDELDLIIRSATVGIALYDTSWANTRLTAFSSEKIARYLQAGVPFIAFKNESYMNLKTEFNCCEVIENMHGLNGAIATIMSDYENYRTECFKAYDKYYNLENTIKPLTRFLLNPVNRDIN